MRSEGDGDARAPHVVVIGWSFPPVGSPAARRTRAMTSAWAASGAHVSVVTVDSPRSVHEQGVEAALARAVDPRVHVTRIVDEHPDFRQEISDWPRERAEDPAGWRDRWLEDAAAMFDESGYGHVLPQLVEGVSALHAQRSVDVVVGVGGPAVSLAAAHEASRSCGAALVLDLARVTEALLGHDDQRVRAALADADVLWSPDEATTERVRGVCGLAVANRVTAAPNGIDDLVAPGVPAAVPSDRKVRAGCFVEPDSWDLFTEAVEGWLVARRTDPVLAGATLTVFGPLPPAADGPRLVLSQAADHGVGFAPAPGVDTLATVHAELDLVIALARGDMSPGRVTDQLLAARPVVWCTAQTPVAGHTFVSCGHVHVVEDMAPESVVAAVSAAVRTPVGDIVVPTPWSPWPVLVDRVIGTEIAR